MGGTSFHACPAWASRATKKFWRKGPNKNCGKGSKSCESCPRASTVQGVSGGYGRRRVNVEGIGGHIVRAVRSCLPGREVGGKVWGSAGAARDTVLRRAGVGAGLVA